MLTIPFNENQFNDIIPSTLVSETHTEGQVTHRSTPKQYLLFVVTEGEVTIKINKSTYNLVKKESIMIFPDEVFAICALSASSHTVSLGFYGENADDFIAKTNFTRTTPTFRFPNDVFDLFLSNIQLSNNQDFFTLSILYLIFAHNNYSNDANVNNNSRNNEHDSLSLLNKIKKYINSNLDKELQISDVADSFNISRVYLYKIFVEHLNLTPKEYIVNKKMRKAYKLIKNNDTPIYVVAEKLGYKDQFVFSKVFKKTYLLSPREVAAGKIPSISVIDDEAGECIWPAKITTDRHYTGDHSLVSKPYFDETKNHIEGWLIRAGYWHSTPLPRSLNIGALTDYGKKGALSFMIFVERQCDITNWCINESDWIRFGSSTEWDTDFQYWIGWHKQIVKEGWNQIILPFGASKWGNVCGNPDYTDFKSFSIMLSIPKHCRCFIDDIKVVRDF